VSGFVWNHLPIGEIGRRLLEDMVISKIEQA
jgi:hypothetical protein